MGFQAEGIEEIMDYHKYAETLKKLIEETEEKIAGIEQSCRPIAPSSSLGRLTRMDAISDQGVQQAMLEASEHRLTALRNAAERLEKGSYGICVRCGKPISSGRLEAVPEALVCIPCLEKKRR